MPAVDVRETAGAVVIATEEQRGVTFGFRVLIEMTVDGREQAGQVADIDPGTMVKAALQVGHEEGGSDAFTGDIGEHEPDAPGPISRKS